MSMSPIPCRVGTTGCRTEFGVSDGTLCVGDEWDETYCVETCEASPTGCEPGEACVPNEDGTGSCWYY
jgi:hypothetical protein